MTALGGPRGNQLAALVESRWLYRKIRLPSPLDATVEYCAHGFGFETVLVDGVIAARKKSWFWYVPRFDFIIQTQSGDLPASIDVRVSPWLTIWRIEIHVDGKKLYAEP